LTAGFLPAKFRHALLFCAFRRESRVMRRLAIATCIVLLLSPVGGQAQLRGHGGPVRALAISPDGATAISGSFDATAIVWSLARNAAEQVLRFHDGAVNAAVMLGKGRAATGGEDGRIALWRFGSEQPDAVLTGHSAPVVDLAVSPDGSSIASASWDHTARVWPLGGGTPRVLEGHQQNVNGVAFLPDGRVVSAGYDAAIRIWPAAASADSPDVITLPTPLNAIAVAPDGEIVAGGADGRVHFLSAAGERSGKVEAQSTPIISVAVSPDGKLVAASSTRGSVALIDRGSRKRARILVGPGLPVWSLAFLPDSRTLLTGGTDRIIRRWDATTGEQFGSIALGGPEARGVRGRPRRGGVSRVRRLPHLAARGREPRRADALWDLRATYRRRVRLSLLRGVPPPRHRVDAGNRRKTLRARPRDVHARHQNAGAAHRLGGRSRGAGRISGARDQAEVSAVRERRHGLRSRGTRASSRR
jgi:cytochrome c